MHLTRTALSDVAAQSGEVDSRELSRVLRRPHVPDWPFSSCI